MGKDVICNLCLEIHGRDTKNPIQCPTCGELVGCFWHRKGTVHIVNCKKKQTTTKSNKLKKGVRLS